MNRETADIKEIIKDESQFLFLKNATVLVTGATGLIGSMLVKALLAANDRYDLGLTVIGQIRNYEKAKNIYKDRFDEVLFITNQCDKCDFIIHTVSPTASRFFISHPVETIRTSVESTINILETARSNNARVIYLSSMEQYGVPYERGQKMTEDTIGMIDHLDIRSSYSESKRLCECLCVSYAKEYGVDARIARLAQTFGAGMPLTDNRMPIQFARAAAEERDIILHTEGRSLSNFVYLTDAITGIIAILGNGEAGQAYNICNDKETKSVKEIAEMIASDISGDKIHVRIEVQNNMGYAPETTMLLDSGKLRRTGWQANVGIEEAYRRLIDYLKEETAGSRYE